MTTQRDSKVSWQVESTLIHHVAQDASRIVCIDEHPTKPWTGKLK